MKEITLVGRGPSWNACAFNTDELWGTLTNLAVPGLADKSYTKLFAVDGPNDEMFYCIDQANKRNIPIVSNQDYATEVLPFGDMKRALNATYFMNTMSYMMGYAIFLGYERIFLDGIDQGPAWEYQCAKPHMTFWVGYAIAKGIDVQMGNASLCWARSALLIAPPTYDFMEEDSKRIYGHVGQVIFAKS